MPDSSSRLDPAANVRVFGWSETVNRAFNTTTFAALIAPMLPQTAGTDPLTAQQAYNGVAVKVDPYGGHSTRASLLRLCPGKSVIALQGEAPGPLKRPSAH